MCDLKYELPLGVIPEMLFIALFIGEQAAQK